MIDNNWWEVKLLPDEVKWIERNGEKRNNNGKALGWATKATSEGATDHVIGLAGEFAVSLVTGISIKQIIASTKKELNEGDLGTMIEVKTRKESDPRRWDLAVNKDQLKHERIYFLALAYRWPENILVVGWEWGRMIEVNGVEYKHRVTGHPFFVLSHKKLKKVSSVFDVLRSNK